MATRQSKILQWSYPDLKAGNPGFELIDGFVRRRKQPSPFLKYPIEGRPIISYEPQLQHKDLFLTFAALARGKGLQDVLDFANSYGHLELSPQIDGIEYGYEVPWESIENPRKEAIDFQIHGEPVKTWLVHAERIDTLVRLGGKLCDPETPIAEFARFLNTRQDRTILRAKPYARSLAEIDEADLNPREAATRLIEAILNEQLNNCTIHTSIKPGRDLRSGLEPNRLLDVIYLQVAQTIGNAERYRECVRCGALLLGTGTRDTCSERCRVAMYRSKQKAS